MNIHEETIIFHRERCKLSSVDIFRIFAYLFESYTSNKISSVHTKGSILQSSYVEIEFKLTS